MIFSDFALLWDCVLGRIYNAAKEEVDSFFFKFFYSIRVKVDLRTASTCQGHLSKADVCCHVELELVQSD